MSELLTQDYFQLFQLPRSFELDRQALADTYRELQRAVHPDKFAHASDRERRLSVQQAAQINEAYRVLKDPIARARYLLELQGHAFDDHQTAMDPMFLMEQMELRERLSELRQGDDPLAELEQLRAEGETRNKALLQELNALFADPSADLVQAAELIRKLQFMRKLLDEATEIEEELLDAL